MLTRQSQSWMLTQQPSQDTWMTSLDSTKRSCLVSSIRHFLILPDLDGNLWLLYDGFLIMFLVMKFVFTAFTLSCPIPGGIFTPTFAIGAVLGQLYVSVLIKILGFFELSNMIQCKYIYPYLTAKFSQRSLLDSRCSSNDCKRY